MANAILLLAMHPDIQDRVVDELKSIFKDQDQEVTAEDCKNLVYLEQVIKEGMRLLPVVPIFVRQTTGDVTLTNGIVLPKDVHVVVANFMTHRSKEDWGDDADTFNPEHFAPDRERHPYAYVPFSGGPRICIGYKYAFLSMKVIMAYLLRRYRFSTNLKMDDLRWELSVTLRLMNKHMVTIKRREW
jgi:cytochrome P450